MLMNLNFKQEGQKIKDDLGNLDLSDEQK